MRWYSRVLEIGSYLFIVVILLITFGAVGPFVFQGEGGSIYSLMIISSVIVGGYGLILRKAGRNLQKKKWRWVLFILLIPPSLLTVLGMFILVDVILILQKLSRVEQSRIETAMREIDSASVRSEIPPNISHHLRGISLIWKILFVSVVTVIGMLTILPETMGKLLSPLFGVDVLPGEIINLIRVVFYVDVVLFTVFVLRSEKGFVVPPSTSSLTLPVEFD